MSPAASVVHNDQQLLSSEAPIQETMAQEHLAEEGRHLDSRPLPASS
jgi:hypothetical protein